MKTTRGRGRPKLAPAQRKSYLMCVRITEALARKIDKAANTAGVSQTTWVRKIVSEAVERTM
jgi:predicted HicB family RNase H-like nuclease